MPGEPWLLHSSTVELITTKAFCTASLLYTSHPSTSDGSERCCPFGRWCWQIRTHHAGSSRRASLAPPVPQRIQFEIAISAFDCVREHCPAYFNNVCIPVAGVSGRAHLRSAEHHDMLVPLTRTQACSTEFPCCSPSRLERASITSSLTIHQSWTV